MVVWKEHALYRILSLDKYSQGTCCVSGMVGTGVQVCILIGEAGKLSSRYSTV